MRTRRRWIVLCGLLLLPLVVAGCGGGGGGAGGGAGHIPVSSLQGTWYGTLEDFNYDLYVFQVTVDSNGLVTSETLSGSATGITHTISALSAHPNIFSLAGSDGSAGGFYVDSDVKYAVIVDDNWNVAVLQKGAVSHPTYTSTDVVGSWSGFEVELDANFDLVDTSGSNATVLNNLTFSGSNKWDTFAGDFTCGLCGYDPSYGLFVFRLTSPASGYVSTFISPDGAFAGGYACPDSGFYPEDCTFSAWRKQ